MELFCGIESLKRRILHPVITIGNFDGVHLGHQKIIRLALEKARSRGGQCVAYTFRPHPQIALRPGAQVPLLSTYDEKLEIFDHLGVDIVIEEPFSREFSTTEPDRFFKEILLQKLGVEAIVVGYDFAFGRERHGHLDSLKEFCQESGVELTIVPPYEVAGQTVSSSKVRQFLLSGKIKEANHFLGRHFFYRGVVIKGEGRGRKLGFPTANLKLENKLALPYGVYVTWAICDGKRYPSVTNIGIRPTFYSENEELPALVETHLLHTTLDLYGNTLEVQFVGRLREEKKFSGVEELKKQILQDCHEAEIILSII
jgi:riboflavin kinase / FMN adenylyltransferase